MLFTVRLEPRAEKELKRLPLDIQNRIGENLRIIATSPYSGKKLKGELTGYYSYRAWPYRIVYQILNHELFVIVIRIGHRQGVYK
ncbi:MAG: type II toxin-antitoxin system RelE/ParE family toxin [Candidatus Magasanikbacteria bacterium]|nr:type II toxin-antitoxin system RelE/ParE family toxin [Candidatus Magasanikbacteria bacterium]